MNQPNILKCTNCGGSMATALPTATGAKQCAYCGYVLAQPGPTTKLDAVQIPSHPQALRKWSQRPQLKSAPSIRRPAGRSSAVRIASLIIALFVVLLVGMGGAVGVFLFYRSSSAPNLAESHSPPQSFFPDQTPHVGSAGMMPRQSMPPSEISTASGRSRVQGLNVAAMDITTVLHQATIQALAINPQARLTRIDARNVVNGLIDATSTNTAVFTYVYNYENSGLSPETNQLEGTISISVSNGEFHSSTSPSANRTTQPLIIPSCSSQRAWAAAVESGVQADSVATFHLYYNSDTRRNAPIVWSIRVEDRSDFRREIDSSDCSIVRNWSTRNHSSRRR